MSGAKLAAFFVKSIILSNSAFPGLLRPVYHLPQIRRIEPDTFASG